jgi:hypothetical protein
MQFTSNATVELGALARVGLRQVWGVEHRSFTPWLAAHLDLLGEAIDIPLSLKGQETDIGTFRADILAKDTATGQAVFIENQLERTDHTHLGQLITYAAGVRAGVVVWIADTFTDEHRAALDWLNESTPNSIKFFGVEIELWRIGESPIAPALMWCPRRMRGHGRSHGRSHGQLPHLWEAKRSELSCSSRIIGANMKGQSRRWKRSWRRLDVRKEPPPTTGVNTGSKRARS